jgi:putative flippase GtrA
MGAMDDARNRRADRLGARGQLEQSVARLLAAVRHVPNWLQLVRYCSVGASGLVVNLVVFSMANRGLPYQAAGVIGFVVSATSNFVLNRIWTFRAHHRAPHHQYARFLTVSFAGLALNESILTALVELGGVRKIVAQAIAIILATPITFLGNRLWSFR